MTNDILVDYVGFVVECKDCNWVVAEDKLGRYEMKDCHGRVDMVVECCPKCGGGNLNCIHFQCNKEDVKEYKKAMDRSPYKGLPVYSNT